MEVILLRKGNDRYRPRCLMRTPTKDLKAIIEERPRRYAEKHDLLDPTRFGFRKRCSLLNVITGDENEYGSPISRRHCRMFLVVLLYVRNAFNSFS